MSSSSSLLFLTCSNLTIVVLASNLLNDALFRGVIKDKLFINITLPSCLLTIYAHDFLKKGSYLMIILGSSYVTPMV